MEDELSYEEWAGLLDASDLESGAGDVLTIEHIHKAMEILDKAGEPRGTYYASPSLGQD